MGKIDSFYVGLAGKRPGRQNWRFSMKWASGPGGRAISVFWLVQSLVLQIGVLQTGVAIASPATDCALQICQEKCAENLLPFKESCLFCAPEQGNCETEECITQFEGCVPGEICDLLYQEMVNGLCIQSNSHAGCIQEELTNPACCDVNPDACPNECEDETDDCHEFATCIDTQAGYDCECMDGYFGSGQACADVDECQTGQHDCDSNATCTNTPGGFTCACNQDYVGDGTSCVYDDDMDGRVGADDCDSTDPTVYDGAPELCDGKDNNCNSMTDEGLADDDVDGVCNAIDACRGHDDAVDTDTDGVADGCDVCPNDVDDDTDGDGSCDGEDLCEGDDESGDVDGDGFCALMLDGTTVVDCNDDEASVYPGAPEVCDGLDNACTGAAPDEDTDMDGDGMTICGGDCDDTDDDVYDGADELCSGVDNDCDQTVDEAEGVAGAVCITACTDPDCADAGLDAGVDGGGASKKKDDGCAVSPVGGSGNGALACLALCAVALLVRKRNRTRPRRLTSGSL